jgi:hypothetical protein
MGENYMNLSKDAVIGDILFFAMVGASFTKKETGVSD